MTASISPIDCDEFAERLADYLEREGDDSARAAVESHALGCGSCGALLADVHRLRADAANLPALEPWRDLWPEIAARIDAPVIPINTGEWRAATGRGRRAARRHWLRVAGVAAALLLAAGLGATITYGVMSGRDGGAPASPTVVASSVAPSRAGESLAANAARVPDDATAGSAASPVAPEGAGNSPAAGTSRPAAALASNAGARTRAEATFDQEIVRLRAIVDRRRAQLDPVTISVVERNLQVIDDAIAQCRAALQKDPASRFLLESLNHALENKVDLLRTAAMLPSRS